MVILCSRDLEAMTTVDAALLASGMEDIVWHPSGAEGAYELHVADAQAALQASEVLSALWREERERQSLQPLPSPSVRAPLWQQPAFAWGVGMASLLLAFYAVTGGAGTHSIWYNDGVFIHDRSVPLAPWRWVTAATLHAHMAHASGNAGMALVMFWAATERLGQGVATLAWLITAVAGFATSALWGPAPAWVVGASGGLFGLWGAICGHAWRYPAATDYKPRTRIVGVVVMLMGMLAFAHDADVAAHLGGCAAGLGMGLACPKRPLQPLFQWTGVLVAAAIIVGSWTSALSVR